MLSKKPRASLIRSKKSEQYMERSGFSGAVRSDETDGFARFHLEAYVIQRLMNLFAVPERHGQRINFNGCFHGGRLDIRKTRDKPDAWTVALLSGAGERYRYKKRASKDALFLLAL